MELTGINLLLILFAPLALILVIVLLLYPLQARLFDREKPLKKLQEDKRREFREATEQKRADLRNLVKETGGRPSKEQLDELGKEIKDMGKEYLNSTWSTTKEIIRVHNEESGFTDTLNELKRSLFKLRNSKATEKKEDSHNKGIETEAE